MGGAHHRFHFHRYKRRLLRYRRMAALGIRGNPAHSRCAASLTPIVIRYRLRIFDDSGARHVCGLGYVNRDRRRLQHRRGTPSKENRPTGEPPGREDLKAPGERYLGTGGIGMLSGPGTLGANAWNRL